MDKKIIFFDIDGTLSDPVYGVLDSTIESIQKLKENKHLVFISTGRTKNTIQDDVLSLGFDGIIAGGGCHIEYNDEIILENYIPAKLLKGVVRFLNENNIYYSLEGRDSVFMTEEMTKYLLNNVNLLKKKQNSEMKKLISNREKITYESNINDLDIDSDLISKICFVSEDSSQVDFIREFVGNDFQVIAHEAPDKSVYNAEVVLRGYNKGFAARKICEYLNISTKNTIAFGDSMNDLDLLDAVNYGVAMGNSIDALKEKAKSVCECADDDGIYKELLRIKLI
ncbi:Cof-type HAD-IIB family hydrolase [Romboutsia weinsteinii]|uniref:Cof-type HAD-IIB family hydrolase n=1 Tax=Romboutsia weinsteinii TaxID=2020949 RepID=A0A371J3E2_9FIRM|nr:Cof-type HAD-IIB family hydrolase [Romboutsia weinsteinii]RDY27299.1 Cof-type HAD-IIB family hydrolase [Romboutsia weinsteinii]